MKFGQSYQAALARDDYPPEWIHSAISYKKLKKCIKQVQNELLSLGLDQVTLDALWQHVGSAPTGTPRSAENDGDIERMLHYTLNGNQVKFVPKLNVAIDPRDGSPMDAWLTPETRRVLRRLARNSKASIISTEADSNEHAPRSRSNETHAENEVSSDGMENSDSDIISADAPGHLETVEIPLHSDSEFFQILRRELDDLDRLQKTEQTELETQIVQLGQELRALKENANMSKSKKKPSQAKSEIEAWRRVLAQYIDSQIFLSSHEADAGARDANQAARQLQLFTQNLSSASQNALNLSKDAAATLDRFMRINVRLLRLLKFQEINRTALSKIMKKFNKRTALHADKADIARALTRPHSFISADLAKATCYTINHELLHIIPQLDDYLCPVCFSISYKPVRLRCGHVFCIRCLVVMQREEQDSCPLCRQKVVLEAHADHVDHALSKFLKANFRDEVKAKQAENEYLAGVDRWGEQYEKARKCVVM